MCEEDADCAESNNGDCVAGECVGVGESMVGDGRGFDENGIIMVNSIWYIPSKLGGHDEVIRKTARFEEADDAFVDADVAPSTQAHVALLARVVWFDDDGVAYTIWAYAIAHCVDCADSFVADGERVWGVGAAAVKEMEVCAADTDCFHANADIARVRFGDGDFS